jgi:tol-pal system-associated acyl-CoA thioesterase
MSASEHRLLLRIYLEDTDAQGIVYHANYLRYFERARSEVIESLGVSIRNVVSVDRRYVVYEMHIKFRQPAFLGDRLEVVTSMQRSSEYRLTFHQRISREMEPRPLVTAEVDVVCIDQSGKLAVLPKNLD